MSGALRPKQSLVTGTTAPSRARPALTQVRTKWSVNIFKGWGKSGTRDAPSSSKAPHDATSELDDPKKRAAFLERSMHGSVSDNIFQDEIDAAAARPPSSQGPPLPPDQQSPEQKTRENMAMVTDPDPRSRIRWQRKKVIQMVRGNGAVSREERIRATERQLLHKSHFMPTSVKKLVMLSRQIAGKPVDEAISQMQWSKKKMAAEVRYYLEEARDLAIAQRGMGLGKVNGEVLEKPRKIVTREGKWIEVTDPTRMYVAQSWVGRGPWRGKEIDYKGRGRMGVIQHPSTSFTVLLKEEKTRIREHEEREAKKAAKGPWVHLPNRPIHGQRPYYSW
ncbi:mitochondrial large ribosomal subunit [Metarhizium album ARSEF 1941]|uniref:Mitochondrial large ribosomal subunit n=1 Tax=Metarhizium album (strain ARSEF 1941) TaxID=1081103 RepID=A0A0B2WJE1_METAS|nr:mitochondrial large ribosomal subunit [Metarhizium album ARSEF 1941]KHN96156.1 mitochondrial large ribosomal subunit [Metarhizium album ARSEF 1941]